MILILKIIEHLLSDIPTFFYDFEDFMTDLVILGFLKFVMYVFVSMA
ncbi:MAG: hypothetical protein LCH52_02335 [Bacteroidetes bacterium]|nr:hypothetical protein [Bacteroidota bacterium]